jgi:GGDEF domain-containing protein
MIASSIAGGKESVICIFLVDRLAALNSRFGRKVGDEILLLVAEHLGRKLPDTSPPFRWSGPAFVAVVGGASQRTEFQIKKIATTKLEKSFEANGRSVLLPISFSVRLQPLTTRDCTETIFDTIDRLIAAHSGEAR